MSEQTFEKVVIANGWYETVPGATPYAPPAGVMHQRGERVKVTKAQLDDLESKGLLGDTLADVDTTVAASAELGTDVIGKSTDLTDEEIASLNAEALIAYITQNPDQVDNVDIIESERTQPRKTVMEAIDAIRANQEK